MQKTYLLSLLLYLSATASSRAIQTDQDATAFPRSVEINDRRCDCYLVSGIDPGYYQNYRIWDFRRYPLHGKRDYAEDGDDDDDDDLADEDGIFNRSENGSSSQSSIILADTPFAKDWMSQAWHREGSSIGPVPIVNSKYNVYITHDPERTHGQDSTYLVLRATRKQDHSSTAEIESRIRNIFHCSFRVRLRITRPDRSFYANSENDTVTMNKTMATGGACAGIFTYHSRQCESDIEILSSESPYTVHYANQPDYDPATDMKIPGASTVAYARKPWTSWTTQRLDWFPDHSRWYADGDLLDSKTYHVPDKPSMLALNLWSDGGNWTGDMNVGESVYMAIEWIQMAYNVSLDKVDLPDMGHAHSNLSLMQEVFEGSDSPDTANADENAKNYRDEPYERQCQRPCWVDDFP